MAYDDTKSIRGALLSLAAVGALLAFSYAGADAAGTGERALARAPCLIPLTGCWTWPLRYTV